MALIQNNKADKASFLDFQVAAPVKTDSNGGFEQVMKSTREPSDSRQPQQKVSGVSEKTGAREIIQKKLAAANSRAQDKVAVSGTEADTEEVLEAVGTLIADIRELLMQVFQVSENELTDLMTEMEITDMDLLNPEVIDQLAVGLTGAEDAMELLFQPEFMDTLKNLKQDIQELKQEILMPLQISEKEVQEILKEKLPKQSDELSAVVRETAPEVEVTLEKSETAASQEKEPSGSKSREGLSQNHNMMQLNQAANPVLTGLEQAVDAVLSDADAENVVRQLVERIQVSVTEDTSSFEMQLNPEHLGKINLQVVARDGAVTAQISAENAAVKEALESQIAVLKESLNNQGIRVEGVEVTIASHEFERNLDEQQERGQERESSQKRRFRFDVLEAAEEELTPADAVVRDMMLANGNQINYMA